MNRICTICARGGSKGVPNKNIRLLIDKPLIAHSILQAKETSLFKYVAVSSDSEEILNTAKKWGADIIVKRPKELATDEAAKIPSIQHCVSSVESLTGEKFDVMVDLDATSPLRLPDDIKKAVDILENSKSGNLITAAPARRSPYFTLVELNDKGFVKLSKSLDKPIVRRQDSPSCYDMNAAVYVWKRDAFFDKNTIFNDDTLLYVMPEERSIDIDSELDFSFVEYLMKRQ